MSLFVLVLLSICIISAGFTAYYQYKCVKNKSRNEVGDVKKYFHGWDDGIPSREELNEEGKVFYDKSMKAGLIFCISLIILVLSRFDLNIVLESIKNLIK